MIEARAKDDIKLLGNTDLILNERRIDIDGNTGVVVQIDIKIIGRRHPTRIHAHATEHLQGAIDKKCFFIVCGRRPKRVPAILI